MSTVLHQDVLSHSQDFLPLNGADYIEFYVGNAQQAAYYYRMAMGMSWVAYAGPETGQSDRTSFVLQQGKVRFVLSTPLRPDMEMAEHIHRHGDGVHDVALWVDDARYAWKETTRRGARSVCEPFETKDGYGTVKMASIATYGDTIHTFVERRNYSGPFLPGYSAVANDPLARSTGLMQVDHVSGNVGWNEMNRWTDFYSRVMGFSACGHYEQPGSTPDCSALMAKPLAAGNGRLRFPVNQPPESLGKSPVKEYLEFNHGPGIQHIALSTTDILYTVSKMREQGVEFVSAPPNYYAEMTKRPGWLREPVSELERLGIQIGHDEEGPMLAIFTRPVEDRPTLFFKIIQRVSSRG
jgi:4-hydroxyphenylpyruvate dioxygenase